MYLEISPGKVSLGSKNYLEVHSVAEGGVVEQWNMPPQQISYIHMYIYIYIYMYIYTYIHMCVYIYIYIEREREREM